MLAFLQAGDAAMALARQTLARTDLAPFSRPLAETRLLAPIRNPSKIIALARNYVAHATEQNAEPPKSPIIFAKYPSAIIGPEETITWDGTLTQQVDAEAELAVVIGRTARHVPEGDALRYVAGYTCCNDVSARDLQFADRQYTRGKSLDTFCPLGPWLVTGDEIPDPQRLEIKALWNGVVMQHASTADMSFGVAYLIAFLSRAFTLLPGDIIATGTPSGVGVFRQPPVFLQDGDEVVVEIERIGKLRNLCAVR
ncbi:MAG: FAA hydrolase family protein [Caldilineae bacterium]|nr:MAG: FAA hydrolase family protein [Caldilineae bacterium]